MQLILKSAIISALKKLDLKQVDFQVESNSNSKYGDFSSNVCMILARKNGGTPFEYAQKIMNLVSDESITSIESLSFSEPGFINFTLKRKYFVEVTKYIFNNSSTWGRNSNYKNKKILIEYTDPNPFKEFHIGHLYTNSVGESLSRLFEMGSAKVKRANYQGDVGMHVAHALWGLIKLGANKNTILDSHTLGKAYSLGATSYKNDTSIQSETKRINREIYNRTNKEINALYDKGRKISLKYFEKIYKLLGTNFDYYFFESEIAPFAKELIISNLNIFSKSDNAYVFVGEKYGLHTRVFINSDGLPTYEAKELALAKVKKNKFSYDISFVITSNEIKEYFKVLKKVMSFIYPDLEKVTEHISHGNIRLKDGKMSSRTGKIISAEDLINEMVVLIQGKTKRKIGITKAKSLAIGAIKYAFLRSDISRDTIFDKEKAVSLEGDSGLYLQYAVARIDSLLGKAAIAEISPNSLFVPEQVYDVEKLLHQFPNVILRSQAERSPHHLVRYLIELVGAFNSFYEMEKIIDKNDKYANYRLMISTSVFYTLKNGLWALGIPTPVKI